MAKRTEGYFQGHDEKELFYQHWLSPEEAQNPGTLIITHGIAEHSECYQLLAEGLKELGWDIYSWDLRGHGRSYGKRGHVDNFRQYIRDLLSFIRLVREKKRGQGPLVLLGHSMGGLITFQTMLEENPEGVDAVVLSSPAFGLSMPVPFIKDKASKLLSRWLPKLTLQNEIVYANLSQDQKVLRTYPIDPLRHDKVSPKLYLGMLEGFEVCEKRASEFTLPVLLQASGQDRLVSLPAAEKVFDLMGAEKKEKIVYQNSFHEVYNDIERDQVYNDLKDFLKGL